MSFLDRWNAMSAGAAAEAILPCNGSRAWASALAARRPVGSLPELQSASDAAWFSLTPADWGQAFRSHPRIGERHAPGETTARARLWSAAEQDALAINAPDPAAFDHDIRSRIAEGNQAYEQKFDRVFLVRAAGRTASEILTILETRLRNTPEAEEREAAEQQRQITGLRLQRWLAEQDGASA